MNYNSYCLKLLQLPQSSEEKMDITSILLPFCILLLYHYQPLAFNVNLDPVFTVLETDSSELKVLAIMMNSKVEQDFECSKE